MKKIPTLILLIGITLPTLAQTGDITMLKGSKFESDGKILKPREVLVLMESNPEAYAAFKKAKSNNDAAGVIGFIGGFMVGWSVGAALGGEPQWGLGAGGVGVLLLGIPLNSAFKKHANTALELYNGKNARNVRPSLRFGVSGISARLTLRI